MEEAVRHLDFFHAGVLWALIAGSGRRAGETSVAAASVTQARIPSFSLYGEAPRRDDDRMLHVETIEFRSARHSWKIRPHLHRTLHQLIFVMRGWFRTEFEGLGEVVVRQGDCIAYQGEIPQEHIEYSDDFQVMQIASPADYGTQNIES